jgi:hypothetical protein
MLYRNLKPRQERFDGVAGILRFHHFRAIAVIHPSFVTQLALLVENEDVWRSPGAKRASHGLRVAIVQVGVVEMLVRSPHFHFFQTVADVGRIEFIDANRFGIVGLNRNDCHTAIAVIGFELLDALFVHLRDWTMIAGEYDDQNGACGIVGQAMNLAIDAR